MYVYCIYICIFTCQSASKRNHLKTVFRNVARYLWYVCTYPKSMHNNEMHILMQEACTIMYNNVIQSPQPRFGQYLLHFLKLASPIFQIVVLDMGSETCEIQVQYISNCIILDYKGKRINECIVRYILVFYLTLPNYSLFLESLQPIYEFAVNPKAVFDVLHLNNIISLLTNQSSL